MKRNMHGAPNNKLNEQLRQMIFQTSGKNYTTEMMNRFRKLKSLEGNCVIKFERRRHKRACVREHISSSTKLWVRWIQNRDDGKILPILNSSCLLQSMHVLEHDASVHESNEKMESPIFFTIFTFLVCQNGFSPDPSWNTNRTPDDGNVR